MLNIIDDFVKKPTQNLLEKMFIDVDFPYYYLEESVNMNNDYEETFLEKTDSTVNSPQFGHTFVNSGVAVSDYYSSITSVPNKMIDILDENVFLFRCRVNMNLIDTRLEGKHHVPHIDMAQENQITAIYYVNDSDGDTLFFDRDGTIKERVTPKKGRLVWWKGIYFHAKCSPINTTKRIVLNMNFLPMPNP